MQFIDLKSSRHASATPSTAALAVLVRSRPVHPGPEVTGDGAQPRRYVGVAHCVSAASGTDALLLALMALDIGRAMR